MVVSKVFIARHGERIDHVDKTWKATAANPDDPFLTERGLKQAAQLGARLAKENIAKIFVSPFLRTIQTANAAAASIPGDVKMHLEHGICELLDPTWYPAQPRLKSDAADAIVKEFPNIAPHYATVHRSVYPETKQQCYERIKKTVLQLAQKETGNILLIGHGITVDYSVRCLLGCEKVDFIDYCALFELERANINSNGTGDNDTKSEGETAAFKFAGELQGPDTTFMDASCRPAGFCVGYK